MTDVEWVVFRPKRTARASDVAADPCRWRDQVEELGTVHAPSVEAANRKALQRWRAGGFFVKSRASLEAEQGLPVGTYYPRLKSQ